ncbi:MAG: YihY/virulence factor BrkB family protein [Anaerolineales bacterium]|nr:YihY/virulence factor BrkB family protein [Anaerolineales bacterium]
MNRLLALWEPMRSRMRQLFENLGETYRRLNRSSGGTLAIVALTIRRFGQTRASENAAVLAYYTLFSIFPFFLSLIVAGSFFLERGEVQQHVQDFIVQAFPASQSLIEENLRTVLTLRGTVGAVGLLGLSWSATGLFTNLIFAINRAWPNTRPRNFLRKRLAGLGVALSLAFLLGLSVFTTTAVDLLLNVDLSKLGLASLDILPMRSLLTRALAWLMKGLIFFGIYMWAPNTRVPIKAAAWGALLAATGWELATAAFTWYLTSGIPRFEVVYGSLGTVVVLMLWIYIGASVVLFGAHLGAAIVAYDLDQRGGTLQSRFLR